VLAVADARVARVVDGLPEQVPGALPAVIALNEADGNHVILDLGSGRFVLYAHMIPGSITVTEGDRVRRGEVLGHLGNSGNSSAPHLHLHVQSAPPTAAANGLPYVIDGYDLIAKIPSTEAFDEAEATGEPAEVVPVEFPGAHVNDLPLDQSIVRFPGG
jgi:murein DD-endopeptidase MepM/ murein hydrolase activator NlpD